MSQIQDLPGDFDESLEIDKLPAEMSLEEIYDKTKVKSAEDRLADPAKSMDEIMQDFSKTPLFMKSLDEAGDAEGENIALDAIRALQYEGTKVEIAQGFKERGNETVKEKMWNDAKEFYTRGIAVLTDKNEDRWGYGEDPKADKKKEKALEEQCYVNRALCQLELKNYRSSTLDCASALQLNPSNVKAYYRCASALLAVGKLSEARDTCLRGLKLDPKNVAMMRLSEQIKHSYRTKEEKQVREGTARAKRQKEKYALATALKARQITICSSDKPPDLEDASIHLSPDPSSPNSTLVFPVVLLYPMDAQSDLIKNFTEKDTIIDHLTYIFPLPWDGEGMYQIASVDCYMDTTSGGMVKVGKKLSLLQMLTSGKTGILDGLVRIHVVPVALAGRWIDEVKKRKVG